MPARNGLRTAGCAKSFGGRDVRSERRSTAGPEVRRRAVREAPDKPQARQRQDADAQPFVPVVELELGGRQGQAGHVEAHADRAEDHERRQPVDRHGGGGIAGGGLHGARAVFR